MKRYSMRFKPLRLICAMAIVCTLLLSCGLTAFAAEEGSADKPVTEPAQTTTVVSVAEPTQGKGNPEITPEPSATATLPTQERKNELYPADVQAVIEDGIRQIVKTYILTATENPADIPRDSFERDGWRYSLADITQKRTNGMDTRQHTETVIINTDSSDLNAILTQLSPTLEYEFEDGYSGLLTLDLKSVKCEAAGYTNSSYTVSATREYPHLSSNDLSLIPKTITDNGRTLELDGVTWETQHTANVDYQDVPESYRAVAKYTAKASKSVVTGYVTTAEYNGEIAKTLAGDTVYTAYFYGMEISPSLKSAEILTPTEITSPTEAPTPTETPALSEVITPIEIPTSTEAPAQRETSGLTTPPDTVTPTPTPTEDKPNGSIPLILLIGVGVIAALLASGGVFFFLRHNVKIYSIGDKGRVLVAKVRVSAKNPTIDLTPLTGRTSSECFGFEIDRLAAKSLNGKTVEVILGSALLEHKIAYEGNTYRIEADFHAGTIKAVY